MDRGLAGSGTNSQGFAFANHRGLTRVSSLSPPPKAGEGYSPKSMFFFFLFSFLFLGGLVGRGVFSSFLLVSFSTRQKPVSTEERVSDRVIRDRVDPTDTSDGWPGDVPTPRIENAYSLSSIVSSLPLSLTAFSLQLHRTMFSYVVRCTLQRTHTHLPYTRYGILCRAGA